MLTLSIPTYYMNMMTIKGHKGCLWPFSMLDLGGPLSDLEGKNSKFRRITFLRMVTKNISMRFQHSPIETVGGVRENVQNRQKTAMTFVTLTLTL